MNCCIYFKTANSPIFASDNEQMEELEMPGNNIYDFKVFTKSRFTLLAEKMVISSDMDVINAEELFLGYPYYIICC